MDSSDQERRKIHDLIDAGRGWRGCPHDAQPEAELERRRPLPSGTDSFGLSAGKSDSPAPSPDPVAHPPKPSGSETKTVSAKIQSPSPKDSAKPEGYTPPPGTRYSRRRHAPFFPYGFALLLVLLAIFAVPIAWGDSDPLGYLLMLLPMVVINFVVLILWALYFIIILAIREANETSRPLRRRVFIMPVLCGTFYVSMLLGLISAGHSADLSMKQSLAQAKNRTPGTQSSPGPKSLDELIAVDSEEVANQFKTSLEQTSIEVEKQLRASLPTPRPTPVPTPWRPYHARLTMHTGVVIEGTVITETDDSITVRISNRTQNTYKKHVFQSIQRIR